MASDNTIIELQLDDDDLRSVSDAIKIRKGFSSMPDCDGGDEYNEGNGAIIAEICRGWMEFLDAGREPGVPSCDEELGK